VEDKNKVHSRSFQLKSHNRRFFPPAGPELIEKKSVTKKKKYCQQRNFHGKHLQHTDFRVDSGTHPPFVRQNEVP
jgi:hypothetical protein